MSVTPGKEEQFIPIFIGNATRGKKRELNKGASGGLKWNQNAVCASN